MHVHSLHLRDRQLPPAPPATTDPRGSRMLCCTGTASTRPSSAPRASGCTTRWPRPPVYRARGGRPPQCGKQRGLGGLSEFKLNLFVFKDATLFGGSVYEIQLDMTTACSCTQRESAADREGRPGRSARRERNKKKGVWKDGLTCMCAQRTLCSLALHMRPSTRQRWSIRCPREKKEKEKNMCDEWKGDRNKKQKGRKSQRPERGRMNELGTDVAPNGRAAGSWEWRKSLED